MAFQPKFRHRGTNRIQTIHLRSAGFLVLASLMTWPITQVSAFQSSSSAELSLEIDRAEQSIMELPLLEGPSPGDGSFSSLNAPQTTEGTELESVIEPPMSPGELEVAPGPAIQGEVVPPPILVEPQQFEDGLWMEESPIMPPKSPSVERHKPALPNRAVLGVYGTMVDGWGFKISAVATGSAAARMKIEPGDVIVKINGTSVTSVNSIQQQLRRSIESNGGTGTILIDNVRSRVKTSCQHSGSVRTCLRFQTIRFRL